MRNILIVIILFAVSFYSCDKEKTLSPEINYDNLYKIEDDPNDPVKHRIFQIYNKYNVPVYFNDTIGQVLITQDVKGEPYYKFETIDLSWGFNYYGNYKYDFLYMTDPAEQMVALDLIEKYLEESHNALYPFLFFVTKSATRYDADKVLEEYGNGKFEIGFRSVYLSGGWTEHQLQSLPGELMRQMVADKILNYPDDLEAFGKVSNQEWYGGKGWSSLISGLPAGWTCDVLYDDWYLGPTMSVGEWEDRRIEARAVVGQLGFVWGHKNTSLWTPDDVDRDLKGFIQQMLKYSPDEFEDLWGGNPLVMQKYKILSEIIVDKLGIEL